MPNIDPDPTAQIESLPRQLLATVEAAGQLQGVCERMDGEAFLPVTIDDLTSGIYRRVLDFGRLFGTASPYGAASAPRPDLDIAAVTCGCTTWAWCSSAM